MQKKRAFILIFFSARAESVISCVKSDCNNRLGQLYGRQKLHSRRKRCGVMVGLYHEERISVLHNGGAGNKRKTK